MIKDLREKVKMYMQLYVFVDIVKKDSPLSAKVAERGYEVCRTHALHVKKGRLPG